VVSFTPRPLNSQGKSLWYSLDRRLGSFSEMGVKIITKVFDESNEE
jgi:hypothetical protein